MIDIRSTSCCGLSDIDYLKGTKPKEAIAKICTDRELNDTPPFYLFSGVVKEKYGENFKKYILKNKLGKIIETPTRINPNSDNRIKAWVWSVNNKEIKRWAKENKKTIEEVQNKY